ncbi:unnamed protein product [Darwinula stevensoni]|uniref:Uncharacterized protein n=1 Tax=Darwinula stevensoni TaxID=69355 RepID=A0A7R8XD45_9CRUS|nr:unnamed protein product [Darwinula stevensoni]CAG0888271.1 unnamed protein product [Darwinula stevensoni]
MHHHWEDKRLAVKEKTNSISKYQYLNAIHHLDQLWIPDTYFLKHGEFKYPPDPVHIALRVYPNGTILYSMRKHLVLSCEGNLNIFPFDDPACRFSIESSHLSTGSISRLTIRLRAFASNRASRVFSTRTMRREKFRDGPHASVVESVVTPMLDLLGVCPEDVTHPGSRFCNYRKAHALEYNIPIVSYERSDLLYEWVNDTTEGKSLLKSKRLTSFNAYMVHNLTEDCPDTMSWRGNYSCLRVELVFTRDKAFYFSTVFIPGIILVTSSFITFWLEWSAAPARVVIGVTTLLTFFTTSNGFRTSLPVVSKLGAMNVWDGVSMFFIYASLLEFVLVNYIGRKKPRGESVYRTGENAVIQRIPDVIQRIGIALIGPFLVGQNRKGDGRGGATAEGEAGEEKGSAGGEESARLNSAHLTEGGTGGGEADVVTLEGGSEKRRRRSRRGTEGNGKRPPPHPIRIAKTIDVISRIIFPVAYSFFLAFFFIRYKGI